VNFKTILQDKDKSIEKESPDFHFVRWLAQEKQLLGIPPSAFYTPDHAWLAHQYIRFNFFKKEETLIEAEQILRSINDL
jgi:aspartate/methionine/tyrosine aminotransferase